MLEKKARTKAIMDMPWAAWAFGATQPDDDEDDGEDDAEDETEPEGGQGVDDRAGEAESEEEAEGGRAQRWPRCW